MSARVRPARGALAAAVAACAALAACEPPVPALQLQLAAGPAQACPSTACGEVDLGCASWLSVRILDPADPEAPFLSQCTPIPLDGRRSMCALGTVDLLAAPLPIRDLEVQVAVYPEAMIAIDPVTGEGTCPSDVRYDAVNGFPVEGGLTPALGGRAYYRPGDEAVTVTLGCTDLGAVNDPTCVGAGVVVDVSATIEDFDLRLPVDAALADRLAVSVGEPRVAGDRFVLTPRNVTTLERTPASPPAWAGAVDQLFTATACLSVLEDAPGATTALTCQRASVVQDRLAFVGARLRASTLAEALAALRLAQFPAAGLTVGIVVDVNGQPVSGQVVAAPGATLQYLTADRRGTVATATTASGIFVSTDAPFGTMFTASRGAIASATGLGGLVEGKVTVVVLRFDEPIVGG